MLEECHGRNTNDDDNDDDDVDDDVDDIRSPNEDSPTQPMIISAADKDHLTASDGLSHQGSVS